MPGNKKTCAGTGRNCIGGDSSGEDGRRPGARGWGSETREPGGRLVRGSGSGRTRQEQESVVWAASCGSEVLIERLLPQPVGGRVPAPGKSSQWTPQPPGSLATPGKQDPNRRPDMASSPLLSHTSLEGWAACMGC